MTNYENPALARINNVELVYQHFGHWPSFHDAEITKVTFEANPGYWPSATFALNVPGIVNKTPMEASFGRNLTCAIELLFTDIQEMTFDCFSHQNVIFDLIIEASSSNIKCTFDSSVGLEAVIVAREVRVLCLAPVTQ